ncbi:MAG: hypothetical protein MJB57_05965 [Gemmatimonadetes bacterium]|nr:hypothetical protein [Gemmatimonadota bacterium]
MTGCGGPRISRAQRGSNRGLVGLFLLCLAVSGALTLAPDRLAAQEDMVGDDGAGFEFFGLVGLIQPIANLTENLGSFGTVIDPDVSFSFDAVGWLSSNVGLSLLGTYSNPDLTALATEFTGAIPDDLGSVDYATAILNLVLRIRGSGSASSLEPYFAIGGGVRHVGVDPIAAPEAEDSTDPAASIAAGIRVPIGGSTWVRAELRDVASFYESPQTGDTILQNDIVIYFGWGTSF